MEQNFQVDEQVMNDFRKFLDDQKVPYTEAELAPVMDWVKSNIKTEIFIDAFGQEEGLKVHAEADPLVVKALDLMPQAKQLADNAKRIVAQRNASQQVANTSR